MFTISCKSLLVVDFIVLLVNIFHEPISLVNRLIVNLHTIYCELLNLYHHHPHVVLLITFQFCKLM